MSLINAAATYRRDDRQTVRVPVVMPLVEVDVDDQGYLTVTLDREPYSADRSLTRNDLKRVLDDIAADLDTPVRVEVREADHSSFTDIVTPRRPRVQVVASARKATSSVGEVAGDGFLPNEEVAVAVVVAHRRDPPTAIDDPPEPIGHREQDESDSGDEHDGADGQLNELGQLRK